MSRVANIKPIILTVCYHLRMSTISNIKQPVLIIGAGRGGSALLKILSEEGRINILGIVDINPVAQGFKLARRLGVSVYTDIEVALKKTGKCIVFNMTHDQHLGDVATQHVGAGNVIGGKEAEFFWSIITDLQSIKNELLENQIRMRAVIHNIREGIISITARGIIEDANPATETIFGYTLNEMVGQPVTMLLSGQPKGKHDSDMANFLRAGDKRSRYREVIAVHKDGHEFPLELSVNEMELSGTKHFVGVMRDITERKVVEEKLTKLAMYDPLTGLPNRTNFFEKLSFSLAQSKRTKSNVALLFIDLDGFKAINDTLGHDAGDQLLMEVAQRLRSCIRESDASARMGGDEFMVILNNLDNTGYAEGAILVADKIIKAINQPTTINGQSCHVGASIGIAIYPNHTQNTDELINIADSAMYLAKGRGKNTYVLWDA